MSVCADLWPRLTISWWSFSWGRPETQMAPIGPVSTPWDQHMPGTAGAAEGLEGLPRRFGEPYESNNGYLERGGLEEGRLRLGQGGLTLIQMGNAPP